MNNIGFLNKIMVNRQFFYKLARVAQTLIIVTLFSGCVMKPPVRPDDPYYAPIMKTQPVREPPKNGSLFSSNSSMLLFTDQKAKNVGDIITVILRERTASSKTSNIEVTKESDTSIAPNAASGLLFGATPSVGGTNLSTNLTGDREFTGEAEADQSNQLSGEITATIVNIFPNGNVAIRGEKWITLNRGAEYIRISGLVRGDDITPENTVMSTKIADARITYSGTGEFAESQEMGWLTRFFNSPMWPF